MGEASKAQAKNSKAKQPGKVKAVLGKRVNVTPGNKLNRDVTAPKWLRAIGRYFAGSYKELKQVKWPTRRAAWSLTFAVIVFTVAMVALILALDYAFDILFKQVIL